MKKKEAFDYIRVHKGFVPYVGIFEMFEEDDEVPQGLIDYYLAMDETGPKGNFIVCSATLPEQLKDLNITL